MKWLWFTYIVFWSAVALVAVLASLGHYIIHPEEVRKAFNETAAMPYEQRLFRVVVDLAVVAAFSYPGLFYVAAAYGAATGAVAGAFGVWSALLYATVAHVVLLFFAEVAKWHPLAQRLAKREKIDWRRYLLWLVASLSLLGVLAL